MKGEILDQERSFWFCNLSILHTILTEDEFNWHTPSFTIFSPHPPHWGRYLLINQTVREPQEVEGEVSKLDQKRAILRPSV